MNWSTLPVVTTLAPAKTVDASIAGFLAVFGANDQGLEQVSALPEPSPIHPSDTNAEVPSDGTRDDSDDDSVHIALLPFPPAPPVPPDPPIPPVPPISPVPPLPPLPPAPPAPPIPPEPPEPPEPPDLPVPPPASKPDAGIGSSSSSGNGHGGESSYGGGFSFGSGVAGSVISHGGAAVVGGTVTTLENIFGGGEHLDNGQRSGDDMIDPPPSGNSGGDPLMPPALHGPGLGPFPAPVDPPNIFLSDPVTPDDVPVEPPNVFLLDPVPPFEPPNVFLLDPVLPGEPPVEPPNAFLADPVGHDLGIIDEGDETAPESGDEEMPPVGHPVQTPPVAPAMTAFLAWVHAQIDPLLLPVNADEDHGATDHEADEDESHGGNGSDMEIDSVGSAIANGHAAVNLAVLPGAPEAAPGPTVTADNASAATHEQAAADTSGTHAFPLLLQLAPGPEHAGPAAQAMDFADVSSNAVTIRTIIDHWLHFMPSSSMIELQGFDIVAAPNADVPMTLMVALTLHSAIPENAVCTPGSEYVAALESAIQASMAMRMDSPERAQQHAAVATLAPDDTVGLVIAGSPEAASLY